MPYNKNVKKYRIPSNRMQGFDYHANGCYFVTICTKNRVHYFGDIVDGKMHLSEIGKIAQLEWMKSIELRPDMNLLLDEFVVMPNHVHCIVIIGDNEFNSTESSKYKNKFGPQSKNLSSIIRGFKIAVTTYARKHNIDFKWQERFHDSIIDDNEGLNRVRAYIINNPQKWKNDEFNVNNIKK